MNYYNVSVDGQYMGIAFVFSTPCTLDGVLDPLREEGGERVYFNPQWLFPIDVHRGGGVGICDSPEEACEVMEGQVQEKLEALFPGEVVKVVLVGSRLTFFQRKIYGEEGEESEEGEEWKNGGLSRYDHS